MVGINFYDINITRRTLELIYCIAFFVYKVDNENHIVDLVFNSTTNQRVMLHRHKCPYVRLITQGEFQFYREIGLHKEVCQTGGHLSSLANGEPHTEGGNY